LKLKSKNYIKSAITKDWSIGLRDNLVSSDFYKVRTGVLMIKGPRL